MSIYWHEDFKQWLFENNNTIWTILVYSKHHKGDYQGAYSSEAEATSEALKQQQINKGTGIYFKVVMAPDKYKDELLRYGNAERETPQYNTYGD